VTVPPPLLYAVPWFAGWLVHLVVPQPLPLPLGITQGIGWVLLVAGVGLIVSAIVLFREAGTSPVPTRPTTALVTNGPFRYTRNPMYVAFAALYLGVTFLADALWPLVLFPVVLVAVQRLVIGKEERYLETKFGPAYRAYRARVRRWL
jgi:protein-S-isoprenylcysteine O-methyltransferase Ste14